MAGRFYTGLLALFLGTFGAQKFYLGRKKEGILCVLLFWTGIPTFLGIFEGLWILGRSNAQWEEYLNTLGKPKGFLDPSILKLYLYPISFSAFIWSLVLNEHPILRFLGFFLLLAIWLYPAKNESLLENRFARIKNYPIRTVASVITSAILVMVVAALGVRAPELTVLSKTNTTQTGGTYEIQVQAITATSVLIDSKEAEKVGDNTYKATIALSAPANKVLIHAEYKGKATDQEITIMRALNDQELAANAKLQQENEAARLVVEKANAEALKKQQEADAKCTKDPKCKKQREIAAKQVEAETWFKDSTNKLSAKYSCANATKSQLKAPSTANFSGEYKTMVEGGIIYVQSYVDAQNSFGAQIRSIFQCKFELVSGELVIVDLQVK